MIGPTLGDQRVAYQRGPQTAEASIDKDDCVARVTVIGHLYSAISWAEPIATVLRYGP